MLRFTPKASFTDMLVGSVSWCLSVSSPWMRAHVEADESLGENIIHVHVFDRVIRTVDCAVYSRKRLSQMNQTLAHID